MNVAVNQCSVQCVGHLSVSHCLLTGHCNYCNHWPPPERDEREREVIAGLPCKLNQPTATTKPSCTLSESVFRACKLSGGQLMINSHIACIIYRVCFFEPKIQKPSDSWLEWICPKITSVASVRKSHFTFSLGQWVESSWLGCSAVLTVVWQHCQPSGGATVNVTA